MTAPKRPNFGNAVVQLRDHMTITDGYRKLVEKELASLQKVMLYAKETRMRQIAAKEFMRLQDLISKDAMFTEAAQERQHAEALEDQVEARRKTIREIDGAVIDEEMKTKAKVNLAANKVKRKAPPRKKPTTGSKKEKTER